MRATPPPGVAGPVGGRQRHAADRLPHQCTSIYLRPLTGQLAKLMGIYDREYYREPERRSFLPSDRAMVVNLVIVTVAVYLIDIFTNRVSFEPDSLHWLSARLACTPETLSKPLLWWRFLTYGFVHDPSNVMHIAFNMFVLWMFGREIEMVYGRREFLYVYLTAIVLAGVAWSAVEYLTDAPLLTPLVGASGGCIAIVMLFILRYPQRMLLLMFFLPVPAWFVGVLIISADVMGFVRDSSSNNVANLAHLAGAAFAFVYFRSGMRLERWVPTGFGGWSLRRRPTLRIHQPGANDADLSEQVDQILEKISREGEASLTAKERKTLENASRQYKQRRGS